VGAKRVTSCPTSWRLSNAPRVCARSKPVFSRQCCCACLFTGSAKIRVSSPMARAHDTPGGAPTLRPQRAGRCAAHASVGITRTGGGLPHPPPATPHLWYAEAHSTHNVRSRKHIYIYIYIYIYIQVLYIYRKQEEDGEKAYISCFHEVKACASESSMNEAHGGAVPHNGCTHTRALPERAGRAGGGPVPRRAATPSPGHT